MRKITTRITRWFRSGPWVAGYSAVAGWVVVCVALGILLVGCQERGSRCQEPITLKSHTNGVASVAFSSDGKWLASASWDQTVKVWDVTPRP